MVWSKVKNIVILILILLNLCLLLLIVGQHLQSMRYEEETLRQTLAALSLNGITVEKDALPDEMELPILNVTKDEEKEQQTAALLLGDGVISTNSGGMSIYSSPTGNLSFYGGGAVMGDLALEWRDLVGADSPTSALLKGLEIEPWSLTPGENEMEVIPLINGAPVFNGTLTFRYDGDILVGIEGRMPGLCTPHQEQEPVITVPTALISLLEYVTESGTVCRSVRGMVPGYYVTSSGTDSARLSPCWRVQTDTVTFYISALDGKVTRAD